MKNLSLRFLNRTKAAVAVTSLVLITAGMPAAEQGLSPAVRQQITALLQEKESRSPAQRKIDSQLIYATKMSRGEAIAPGVPTLRLHFAADANGRVLVDIDAVVTDGLLAQIQASGEIIGTVRQFDAIRAWVPLTQLETLAVAPGVKWIRPADKAVTRTGRLTSEGDNTHRAGLTRTNFLVSGSGVKVGVLSDSVDFLGNSFFSGDLTKVTVLPGQQGTGAGEGTAMMEIIADLAPKADLFYATAFNSVASFAQNILDLRSFGCDVIVDDVGYASEPPFQDGRIARAVNTVTADGALFFSAASNSGNKNDGTSCTWEGDFLDGGQGTIGTASGNLHLFGTNVLNRVTLDAITFGANASFWWSDPVGGATNDYDLFIVDPAGTAVVASSTNPQNGTQDPWEFAGPVNTGDQIGLIKVRGASRFFHLEIFGGGGTLEFSTEGNTSGHNCAADAFGVAAVDVFGIFPNAFTGGSANPVESFSSDGPRRIFYDAQGIAITTNNFLATGGLVRQKPDIAAADGVKTTVPGFNPFSGTSAAAPHAAALAALILSYNPALTPQQVRFALTNTALDIETPGPDRDSGFGIVMPDSALRSLPPPLPSLVSSNLSGGNLNGIIEYNECHDLDLAIRNNAVSAASGVSAVLTTTTPGVTVVQGFSAYPNIVPGETVLNLVPFRFYTALNFACGTPIDFAFRISSSAGPVTNTFRIKTGTVGPLPVTFANNNVFPIPDAVNAPTNFVDVPIAVTNVFGPIGKVVLAVHILHPTDVDLSLQLIAPDGSRVDLARNRGADNPNYGLSCAEPTTFDDDAGTNIVEALPPFAGSYAPQQSLGSFSGKSGAAVNGNWRLRVRDSINTITGAVQCVTLSLYPALCTDGGGDCSSDLAVSITDAPDPVLVGSNLTYTIAVTNVSPRPAPVATLLDTLPPGVTVVSFTSSRGSCSASPGFVNCSLGTISGGAGAVVRIVAVPSAAGTIVNTVSVSSVAADVNPADNTANTTTVVRNPSPIIVPYGSMLVSESIAPPSGGIDPGETVVVNFALRNLGTLSTTTNMKAKLLITNGIVGLTEEQYFGELIPNGPAVSRPFAFTAMGIEGGTVTALFRITDGTNDLGIISFSFGLGGAVGYVNQGVLNIPDNGPAAPYPSVITVAGLAGLIGKVTVTISNLTHRFPEDIDMLLVSPAGQKVILMSDAGASRSITNVVLNFDDAATSTLPGGDSAIESGRYRPTDFSSPPDEAFPSPAPSGPYSTTLSAFGGINPNGTWSLFVFDDTAGDAGRISGGWSLGIETFDPVNPRVDVTVQVVDSPDPVMLGSNLTYTVTITNAGPEISPAVMLTNALPLGVTFVSADSSQGVCTNDAGTIICALGPLSAGADATVTIVATATVPGSQIFTASVGDAVADFNLADNTATAITEVSAAADLSVSAAASPDPATVNDILTYFITITNRGPNTASAVSVTQLLPAGFVFDSATTSQGSVTVGLNDVTWSVGALGNGDTGLLTVTGTTPLAVGVLRSEIGIFSPSPADPNPADNSLTLLTTNLNPAYIIVASTANLVSESGPTTGGIDEGETVEINFYLLNIGTDNTTDLTVTILTNAGVTAPGPAQYYGILEAGGASVGRTNSFTAVGTNGGVITVTLQLQDGALDLGTVDFTFPLGNTISFTQPDDIDIPDFGLSSPFPSTINVSGLTGTVAKVSVSISNLNHTFPDDIDMLLVGPGNLMAMLMSDVGGGYEVNDLALTFDQEAAANLPDVLAISAGTYLPTDYDSNDLLPLPAPGGPYFASLATFIGSDPNGAWSLYVYDDSFGDEGRIIGGWTLHLSTVGMVQPEAALLAARPLNPSGQFDYLIKGEAGGTYQIEVSSDLQHWTPVSTNTLTTGTLLFHDTTTPTRTQRFYRALRRP